MIIIFLISVEPRVNIQVFESSWRISSLSVKSIERCERRKISNDYILRILENNLVTYKYNSIVHSIIEDLNLSRSIKATFLQDFLEI